MKRLGLLAALLIASKPAAADEGMWTLNGFPTAEVKKRYGFEATPQWLKKVQLSSVRLAGGCSGSLVSGDGLVMTNHHCVHSCVEQLSTRGKDLVKRGFRAKTPKQEKVCPAMEINQLVEITDVTKKIEAATAKLTGEAYTKARNKAMADVEKSCASSDKLRCDVVSLYNGGRYDLYKYRRFQDVRLAFAPRMRRPLR